jgi:hypothetical protein
VFSEQNLAPGTEFATYGCWIGNAENDSWIGAVELNEAVCTEPLAV